MIEITAASKDNFPSERDLRVGLAKFYPGWTIQRVEDKGEEWLVRLADGPPPFLKKKDGEEPAEDSGDAPDESSDDESSEEDESDESESEGDESEGDSDDGGGDAVGKLKSLVDQITSLMDEIVNKSGEVAEDAKAKDDKIKEIGDSVKEHLAPEAPPSDMAPVPPDAATAPPTGGPPVPQGPRGPAKRRPMPGAPGIGAFTKRRTEVVSHPGTNDKGERISLVAAAAELEADPSFAEYVVSGMTENRDGTYSARLTLKS